MVASLEARPPLPQPFPEFSPCRGSGLLHCSSIGVWADDFIQIYGSSWVKSRSLRESPVTDSLSLRTLFVNCSGREGVLDIIQNVCRSCTRVS